MVMNVAQILMQEYASPVKHEIITQRLSGLTKFNTEMLSYLGKSLMEYRVITMGENGYYYIKPGVFIIEFEISVPEREQIIRRKMEFLMDTLHLCCFIGWSGVPLSTDSRSPDCRLII